MDSCVLKNECIDEMAVEGGVSQQVSEITKKAMEQGMQPNYLRLIARTRLF
jgi:phosphoserine phosphatase